MLSYHVLYEQTPWNARAALFDDRGRLVSLQFDDVALPFTEGAVVWGRVQAVEPSLGGAFVDMGDTLPGFLSLSTLPEGRRLVQGASVLVRVVRAAFGEKGARLTAKVLAREPEALQAPALVLPAPSALTRVLHDAGANPVACWILHEGVRADVAKKVPECNIRLVDEDEWAEWEDKLAEELAFMQADPAVWPLFTGKLTVEITRAVATMDVDAAPMPGVARGEAILAANLSAGEEVVRLCRLLDLGGTIIVDFVTPKTKAHRSLITESLLASFTALDDHFVEIRPMSRFGIVEINRERVGASLNLFLKTPLAVAGLVLLDLWRDVPVRGRKPTAKRVQVAPPVAEILKARLTPDMCLRHLGALVDVVSMPEFPLVKVGVSSV